MKAQHSIIEKHGKHHVTVWINGYTEATKIFDDEQEAHKRAKKKTQEVQEFYEDVLLA